MDALFLRQPAGVGNADELVRLYVRRDEGSIRTLSGSTGSYVDYETIREMVTGLSGAAAFRYVTGFDLGRGYDAQRVRGRAVSQSFFALLQVEMAAGRQFLPEEDRTSGTHPVAVVGHGFWQNQLGGDPEVVGRTLVINEQTVVIVGVANELFTGIEPESVDVS